MDKIVTFTGQVVITVDHEDEVTFAIRDVLNDFCYSWDIESIKEY